MHEYFQRQSELLSSLSIAIHAGNKGACAELLNEMSKLNKAMADSLAPKADKPKAEEKTEKAGSKKKKG